MEIKFKKGSSWRTRGGWEAIHFREIDNEKFFAFHARDGGKLRTHTSMGIDSLNPDYDLIAPWVDPWEGEILIMRCPKGGVYPILSPYTHLRDEIIARVKVKERDGM